MTTHTLHPDSHENGLADDCPRCDEHARYPFDGLDNSNLLALADRLAKNQSARSINEAVAMNAIRTALWHAEKLHHAGVRL